MEFVALSWNDKTWSHHVPIETADDKYLELRRKLSLSVSGEGNSANRADFWVPPTEAEAEAQAEPKIFRLVLPMLCN